MDRMTKRFTIEESENQDTIVDNEGPDDYYHLGNDTRDVEGICKLLNQQDQQIKRQAKVNEQQEKEYQEQYSKIQKLQKRIELLESLIPKELMEE